MALRIREEAAGLPVYRPGRRPPLIDGLPAYKLSSNENPFPPLPAEFKGDRVVLQLNFAYNVPK